MDALAALHIRVHRPRSVATYVLSISPHPSWPADWRERLGPLSPSPQYTLTLQPATHANSRLWAHAPTVDLTPAWRPVLGRLHDDHQPTSVQDADDAWHLRATPSPPPLGLLPAGPSPRAFTPFPVNSSYVIRLPFYAFRLQLRLVTLAPFPDHGSHLLLELLTAPVSHGLLHFAVCPPRCGTHCLL